MLSDGQNGQISRRYWARGIHYKDDIMFRYMDAIVPEHFDCTLLSTAVQLNIECLVDFILKTSKHADGNPENRLDSRSSVYTESDFVSASCTSASSASVSIARKFLDRGIDINAKGPGVQTPLGRAIMSDDHEMVAFLLSRSADVHQYGFDALDRGLNRMSLLSMAAARGSVKSMEHLLDHGLDVLSIGTNANEIPAFHLAVAFGQSEVINLLLSRNIDVDLRWRRPNMTPLMCAAVPLARAGYQSALGQRVDTFSNIIGILIEHGANIDAQDKGGRTALHRGVVQGNMESTSALLSSGADPNVTDFCGENPLLLAISTRPDDIQMIGLLLDHQADVNACGPSGVHPLGLTIVTGQIEAARTLISRGAKVNSVFKWEEELLFPLAAAILRRSDTMVDLLLESGAQVTPQGTEGRSSLELAVASGQVNILRSLLKNLPQGRSESELLGVVLREAIILGGKAMMLRALFEAGACLENDGVGLNTFMALSFALAKSDFETIEVLLEHGVDVNAKFLGQSVFSAIVTLPIKAHGARHSGAIRCLNLLLDHTAHDWECDLIAAAASGSTQAARVILDHEKCPLKLPGGWYLGVQVRILRMIDLLYDRSLVLGKVAHGIWKVPRLAKTLIALLALFIACCLFLVLSTTWCDRLGLSVMFLGRFH